jgi:hypothetical protein
MPYKPLDVHELENIFEQSKKFLDYSKIKKIR